LTDAVLKEQMMPGSYTKLTLWLCRTDVQLFCTFQNKWRDNFSRLSLCACTSLPFACTLKSCHSFCLVLFPPTWVWLKLHVRRVLKCAFTWDSLIILRWSWGWQNIKMKLLTTVKADHWLFPPTFFIQVRMCQDV